MVETRSEVILPVAPEQAFAAVADLDHADWLPAIRGVRRVSGTSGTVGARYEVEAGLVGRHLRGILACRELTPSKRMVMVLEDGLDLTITVEVKPVSGGCSVQIGARYSVGAGPLAAAVERASQGAARRETARACEQLAARFGRKTDARQLA